MLVMPLGTIGTRSSSSDGVDGVAVVSAIFAAENPGEATAELLKLSKEMVYHG